MRLVMRILRQTTICMGKLTLVDPVLQTAPAIKRMFKPCCVVSYLCFRVFHQATLSVCFKGFSKEATHWEGSGLSMLSFQTREGISMFYRYENVSLSVTWIIHYSRVSLPGRAQDPYIVDMAKNWEIIRLRWGLISEGNLGTISLISLVYSLLVILRCPQWYRIMRSCSSVFLLPLEVLSKKLFTFTILLSKAQNYFEKY